MLELPPDHRALLATVRRFCRERLEPHVAAFEAGDEPLEPFFRELSEALGLREVASALVDGTPSPFEGLPPLLLTSFVMHELSRCCPGVALSFGATRLHLLVLDTNLAAIGFYESRGWKWVGRKNDRMGGSDVVALVCALALEPTLPLCRL